MVKKGCHYKLLGYNYLCINLSGYIYVKGVGYGSKNDVTMNV